MSLDLKQELKIKAFESIEQETLIALLRTTDMLMAEINGLLKERQLSSPLYNVLRILRGAGAEGLACGEIAARLVQRDPDVTRLVDRLEERGYVTRERQRADRRVIRIVIATRGLDLLKGLDQPIADLHKRQLGGVGKKRLRELNELLATIRSRS
ncbi:MAG: MarR family winged helix-turn-helix transcriptional regulator [Planctomycetota bacterium]